MDETTLALDKAWKNTCKVLFGQEIGDCTEYAKWLAEFVDPIYIKKSNISGRDVIFSTSDYPAGSKAACLDEVDFGKKFTPLGINQVKDIDSIMEAINDRVCYAGSVVLGSSSHVSGSSNITDSHYILNTTLTGKSKYMAYCTQCVLDNCGFGGNAFSECEYCLKCHEGTRLKRCFELWMSQDSSDCYYSHGLKNCANCMFSFNLQNKKNAIGNLALPTEKYKEIKSKLISEMLGIVRKDKRLPSLLELVAGKKEIQVPSLALPKAALQKTDKSKMEEAFAQTMTLLLDQDFSKGIDACSGWLLEHTHGLDKCKSAASGSVVFLAHYGNYSDLPQNRLLTLEEAKAFGEKLSLKPDEVNGLGFENVKQVIGKIAFFNTDIQDGENWNDIDCAINITASNCYRTVCSAYSKYCAYTFWPQSSEYCFGCDIIFYSSFCANCYHSNNLKRCLEMDSCSNCSDCLFCHNVENCRNSMFCFNAKNLQYAVGNVEVGRERYMQIRKSVLAEFAKKLEAEKKPGLSIFSIGSQTKAKQKA